jgi:hypothetical protein
MGNGPPQEMKLSEEIRKEAKSYRKNRTFTLDEEQLKEWAGKAEMLEQVNEQLNVYCQELEGQLVEVDLRVRKEDESTSRDHPDS